MASEEMYAERISRYGYPELERLWDDICIGDTPDWEKGRALEYLIVRAFQLEGATVCYSYRVPLAGDGGRILEQIDGAVHTDGMSCLIECKHTAQRAVGLEPIAKLRDQLLRRPGPTVGIVVSFSGFTLPAVVSARFAAPQTILLWNGEEVGLALAKRKMRAALLTKYRLFVERGLPDLNITLKGVLEA